MSRKLRFGVAILGALGACGLPNEREAMTSPFMTGGPPEDPDLIEDARPLVDPGIRLSRGFPDCLNYPSGQVTCWHHAFGSAGDLWDVPDVADAVEVTDALEHGCVRHATGNVSCWGFNHHSQLGHALPRGQTTQLPLQLGNVVLAKIATSHHAMCGIRPSGQAVCWGGSYGGPLGDPSVYETPDEVEVLGVPDAIDISASPVLVCAVRGTGQVLCWVDRSAPIPIPGIDNAVQIDVGPARTCARLADGAVRCWGWDGVAPTATTAISGLRDIIQITSSCGRRRSGLVQCWWDSSTAIPLVGVRDATDLSTDTRAGTTCATKSDSTAVCWKWGSVSVRPFPATY